MSNIHLTTTHATHEDVNNMVSCRDAVFRTKGKKLFSVYLVAFLIAGLIFGIAYGFRDYIFDFVESTFGINLAGDSESAEVIIPDEDMNLTLISNSSTVKKYDINDLYFDGEYKFKYSYSEDQLISVEGTFPDSKLKNKISYTLIDNNGYEISLETVDGAAYIPAAQPIGRYTLTAYIPETYISNKEAYNELYMTTFVIIEKSVVDLSGAYISFDEGKITYDSYEHSFSWHDITINGTTVTELPGDLSIAYSVYDKVADKDITYDLNGDALVNAGEYTVSAKVSADSNYKVEGKSFESTLFIQKKTLKGLTVKVPEDFTYDGETRAEITIAGLPKGHYDIVITYMANFLNDDNKTVVGGEDAYNEITDRSENKIYDKVTNTFSCAHVKDAGKYEFTVDFGRNFTTDEEVGGEFTIRKAKLNLSDIQYVYYYYMLENKLVNNQKVIDLIQFEGKGSPVYDAKYYFYAAKAGTIPAGVTVTYTATKENVADVNYEYSSDMLNMLESTYFVDDISNKSEIDANLAKGFINAGTYNVVATYSGRNYITATDSDKHFTISKANMSGITLDPETFVYEEGTNRVLKLNGQVPEKDKASITLMTIYTDKKGTTYTLNGFVPQTFAGSYNYRAVIESDNYNTLDLSATLTIEKATFDLPDFEEDWHFKNGKTLFAPDSSKYDVPYGTSVTLKNGDKVIKGVNKLGDYKLTMLFTNDNYHTHAITFSYRIVFNPLIVLFCLVVGLVLALILLAIVLPLRRRKDRISRENLIALRTQLSAERGGIICESVAKTKDKFSKKKGRLYLTPKALEFYDGNYPMNHKNFTILPKDIVDIKDYGLYNTKLAIASRSGWRKIKVPAGTAKMWKKEIIHFKNMQQAYYSELHIINPKEPRP